MSCCKHEYPWPSLVTSPNRSSPLVSLLGHIPYPHIAAECMFELVVLLLPGHMWGSLMSSSLLLQQCPACLVRLTWIVFVMGGWWPYSWCLVGCCRQVLFNIARSILLLYIYIYRVARLVYIYIYIYISKLLCTSKMRVEKWKWKYVVPSISFQTFFFVQAFKIVIDSWKFSILLLYSLWDDWPSFMISGSNEQLQQQMEYALLKPDYHNWWISKMQSDILKERYAIWFCFKLGKNATDTYGMLQTSFRPSCMNRASVFE